MLKKLTTILFVFCFASVFGQTTQTTSDQNAPFVVNPNPHTIQNGIDVPVEEIFGSNANMYGPSGVRGRGNIFHCTIARKLIEHRFYLNPTAAADMWFVVYEGATFAGVYNLVSSVNLTGQGPGEGWYSSGPIDYDLQAGMYYMIYLQWDVTANYWNEQGVTPYPVPCSFGEQVSGIGWNWVPAYGTPPPATQGPNGEPLLSGVSYYQTIVTDDIGGGGTTFFDDFDSYTAGVQLVAQNNIDWDTWSGGGGTSEDPFVSNAFSFSGSNSVVIAQNNDLIRYHGQLTSGKWYISFLMYIPTGGSGYFNSMSGFTPNPFQWAHEVYFDAGGGGRLMGLPGAPIPFSWAENTWQQAVVVVDLDLNQAEFWFGDSDPLTVIGSWQWTQGGTVNLQLDATDFFGAAATEEMYVDNYYFSDIPPQIIPVELTSFTASVNDNDVTLNWETASEINNQGFEIERNSGNGFENIGYVAGFGTSTETHSYSFVDASLNEGTYSYRLKQIDYDGTFEYSDVVEVDITIPDVFVLEQNYPNPFNPSTKINFRLAVDSKVSLKVFDVLGQEVATLINSDLVAGSHNVEFSAANINSGVYFYRIDATGIDGTNFTNVKKMILTK